MIIYTPNTFPSESFAHTQFNQLLTGILVINFEI